MGQLNIKKALLVALRFIFCGGLALSLAACTMGEPPPYDLPSAQSVQPGRSYTVGPNENVYAISQNFGVKMRDIIALNNLQPPFALRKGQVITLPAKAATTGTGRYNAQTPINLLERDEEPPPAFNAAAEESPLRPADVTAVPLGDPGPAPQTLPPQEPAVQTASSIPFEQPVPIAPPDTTAPEASAQTTQNGTPVFGWPVRGTIISVFGPKAKGLDNDGINIAAPKGSPVVAARDGTVVYAGNEMKGFGNLVLLRHEKGWVTAYAHLDRMVVKKDGTVAKGGSIGTVGTTGGVASPQLHFEIRRNGVPVDPELMIK